MKVVITNKASYPREIQYFRENQFITLSPHDSFEIVDVHDSVAIAYYRSLESSGFLVEFLEDNCKELPSEGTLSHDQDHALENIIESDKIDLSEFSEDDLKRIVKNLGVETRVRARWKLESIILENLPRNASPGKYLEKRV